MTTYYVANAGSDSNSGLSPLVPFQTLTHAFSVASTGDTVLANGGDMFTELAAASAAGQTLGVYGVGQATIDGGGARVAASTNGYANVTFVGIHATNFTPDGFLMDAAGAIAMFCVADGWTGTAFSLLAGHGNGVRIAAAACAVYNSVFSSAAGNDYTCGVRLMGGATSATIQNNIFVLAERSTFVEGDAGSTTGNRFSHNDYYGGAALPFVWNGVAYDYADWTNPGTTHGNFTGYTASPYGSWSGLWYLYIDPTLGLGHTAVENVDYVSQTNVYPAAFPNQTTLRWRVPSFPPALAGVYGYLDVTFGNYDDSGGSITPRQVSAITHLTTSVVYSYAATDFTGLHEMWLTTTAHASGTLTDKVFEVGMFPHLNASAVSYITSLTSIGTYNDGVRNWQVVVDDSSSPPFIIFARSDHADFTGDFDWKAALNYLIGETVITGSEYFNGLAFGVEPHTGTGTLTIDNFSIKYS